MSQVATPPRQRLTAEDLFRRNLRDERTELIAGELLRRSPAGAEQGVIAMRIGAPDTVRAPDAAFISRERLGEGHLPKKFWPLAPDLAVEVVSPSESAEQVQERLRDWFAAGVRAVWMLYPGTASVHAYHSPSEVRIFQRGEVLTGGDDLLPGFSCSVSELFR